MAEQPLKDKDYDLINVIYHAAKAMETYGTYARDAKGNGDNDAANFFEEVRQQNQQVVERGKSILKTRL